MALLSDIDWLILLGVGAFLLFGGQQREMLRTLGRWYGRAMRLKRDLLAEVSRAADLPTPAPGRPTSIRAALLDQMGGVEKWSGIPIAVPTPPALASLPTPANPWSWGMGPATWSMTVAAPNRDERGYA